MLTKQCISYHTVGATSCARTLVRKCKNGKLCRWTKIDYFLLEVLYSLFKTLSINILRCVNPVHPIAVQSCTQSVPIRKFGGGHDLTCEQAYFEFDRSSIALW